MKRIPMVDPRCAMCRHFVPDSREAHDGECRRHSPQIAVGSGTLGAVWPMVLTSDLCGDYAVDHDRALALVRPGAETKKLHMDVRGNWVV